MWEEYLKAAIEAALLAREKILEIYHTDFEVEIKSDDSPVTLADKAADKIIQEYLKKAFPHTAFLTEESDDDLSRLDNDYVWIIDPVDGTKDFVAKDGEFTTNIALAYKHDLVVGVVTVPATGEIYYATKDGGAFYEKGAIKERMHVSSKTKDITCFTSVFHFNEKEKKIIENLSDVIGKTQKLGSSIKVCEIAHGNGEVTFRFTPNTKEWDTAACQIIIEEAGGIMVEPDGNRLMYNRKDVYNRSGYIAANVKENLFLDKVEK